MKRYILRIVQGVIISLLVVLAGCGTNGSSGGTSSNSGTSTAGPVSISTDKSTYKPTDSIRVLVTNTLQSAIYAFDTRAGCSILAMQVQANGTWQGANIARCPLGRPAMRVAIQPGHTYTATIQAGYGGTSSVIFPAGVYRFLLSYSMSATSPPQQNTTTIYSATIMVVNG